MTAPAEREYPRKSNSTNELRSRQVSTGNGRTVEVGNWNDNIAILEKAIAALNSGRPRDACRLASALHRHIWLTGEVKSRPLLKPIMDLLIRIEGEPPRGTPSSGTANPPHQLGGELQAADHMQVGCGLCALVLDLLRDGESEAALLLIGLRRAGWDCQDIEELVARERLHVAIEPVQL